MATAIDAAEMDEKRDDRNTDEDKGRREPDEQICHPCSVPAGRVEG